MIKLFIDNTRADLFKDEGIEITQTVKNLQDISKTFSSFSQSFTLPASNTNNGIFKHYYRDDIDNAINNLNRLDAYITLNGVVFLTGSIEIEGASINRGIPENYSITFYGSTATIKELVGEDTLQDLDFATYNHEYSSTKILEGFGDSSTSATLGVDGDSDLIYPLCSPVKNWVYNSLSGANDDNNIAFNSPSEGNEHGVNFYELKPSLKVARVFDAIETKYGITFSGEFLTLSAFTDLYLWLHSFEGYMYRDQDTNVSQGTVKVKPDGFFKTRASGRWDYNTTTKAIEYRTTLSRPYTLYTRVPGKLHTVRVTVESLTDDFYIYLYKNGQLFSSQIATATGDYDFPVFVRPGPNFNLEVYVGRTTTSLTYQLDISILDSSSNILLDLDQTTTTALGEDVIISNLMPKISVIEFINGIVRMFNLVVTSDDGSTFSFEDYNTFYDAGTERDFDRWLDLTKIEVKNVSKYNAINLKYKESDQVQQKRFRQLNGRGYGDLDLNFRFDVSDRLDVEVPFNQPYFTVLDDQNAGGSVDFSTYLSIQVDEDGVSESYYDSPILFYRTGTLDISSTPIGYVDASSAVTEINLINFCDITDSVNASDADSTNFSDDIIEYLGSQPNDNLYTDYWRDFLTDTYDNRVRLLEVEAQIPFGLLINMNLNDIILIRGRRYKINAMTTNFGTGKTSLELITLV